MAKLRAVYDYQPQEDNEVGFEEGEEVELMAKLDDGWWLVRARGIAYGLVPSNYFENEHQDQ